MWGVFFARCGSRVVGAPAYWSKCMNFHMIGGLVAGLGLAETRRWRSGRERGAGSGLVLRPPGRARAGCLRAMGRWRERLDEKVAPGGIGGGIAQWFLRAAGALARMVPI